MFQSKVGRYRYYAQHCITALIAVLLLTAKEQENSEGNQKNNGTLLFYIGLFKVIKCLIFLFKHFLDARAEVRETFSLVFWKIKEIYDFLLKLLDLYNTVCQH